jgi:hypothetical protein
MDSLTSSTVLDLCVCGHASVWREDAHAEAAGARAYGSLDFLLANAALCAL